MVDIATLGIRVESDQVATADGRLDELSAAAGRAERSVEGLSQATRAVDGHARNMAMAVDATNRQMRAAQQAGLGLTRQFSDIGVSIASGMPFWMVLIQQGSQVQDQFALMRQQGVGLTAALRAMYATLTPMLVVLAPIAAVAGTAAAGFALLNRELAKGYPDDITKGLGLTAEQLERVESRTVTFGDTVAATFTVIGRHIMDGPVGDGLDFLGRKFSEVMDFIGRVVLNGSAIWSGIFIGSYRTVVEQWRNLPAVFGDLVVTAANAAIRGLEGLINAASRGVNTVLVAMDAIRIAQGQAALGFRLGEADLGQIENQWAGAGERLGNAAAGNILSAIRETRGQILGLLDEIGDEALRRATSRALEEAGDPNQGRERARRQTELEKQIAETLRYIAALREQADTYGMNAIAAKEYEIAQAAAEAPTRALREQVQRYGEVLLDKMRIEAADVRTKRDQIEMLQLEARLIGASNMERAVSIALLQEQQRLREAGLTPADAGYALAIASAVQLAAASEDLRQRQDAYNLSLEQTLDLARQLDDEARNIASGLSSAFGSFGDAIGGVLTSMTSYTARIAEIDERQRELAERGQQGSRQFAILERQRAQASAQSYGDMAAAAKGFFDENSAGYRALEAVERGYRAFQLISSAAAIAQGWIETSQSVAQATAKTTADTAAGGAKMFSQLGVFAFPAVAAMVAVLAGLGARGGGGGAAPTLPSVNTGAGTVLGAPDEASQSIANSLELAERYYDRDLKFSSEMVQSLRAIEDNIGAVTTAIARQVGAGGSFDTAGLNLGTTTGGGFLGIGQTTRTRDLVDQGLQLASGSLADLIAGGVQGLAYQVVQTTKTRSGFLGIGGGTSTSNQETSTAIDAALGAQLGQLLASLRDGVLSAATVLGVQGAGAVLDTFRVELGRISFEGMSNAEVSEALSAVFSAVGDQMAGAIIPGLEAFQRAGEGLMETLTRLAVEYETVDGVLSSIGMTFRTVGLESVEARTRLVELAGGIDAFIESADLFASEFLTDAQRLAPVQAAVNAELTRLGIATDISREQFAALVMGLDVSTQSGAAMYAALMNLAPALDLVLDASDDLARSAAEAAARIMEQGRSLSIGLANAVGNSALALQMQREDTLAGLDPSLRGLQRVVWQAEDMAKRQTEAQNAVNAASQALTQTYEREANVLRSTADRFRGFARSLGDFRRSLEGADSASGGYAAARSEFERISSLARLGNEDALGQLQGVSEAYLRESQGYHATSLDYLRDLGAVRQALQQAEDVAGRTATNAERQLEEITRMAGGVDQVGSAVQSVAEAINRLADAQSALGQVNAPGGRNWGANPMVNQLLAMGTGYTGDFGSGGFQAFIEKQDEATKQLARTILKATGQDFRISNFATGAVFTSPETFSMGASGIGRMAEAGPEAIMPLTWGPEGLGVRASSNDNAEMVAELRALRQEMADLKAAAVSTAVHTARTAAYTKQTADDWDQVVNGGTPIRTEAA